MSYTPTFIIQPIFGSAWTLIAGFLTWGFYFSGTKNIRVNGELVIQAEFNSLIWPKILLGVFLVIGVLCLITGIRQVIRNSKTERMGEKCYGKILQIYRYGVRINDRPEYKADFAVYIPSLNSVEIISEVIGMESYLFPKKPFFNIKFLDGDINIGKKANKDEVHSYIVDRINEKLGNSEKTDDNIIEINGEKYIKIEN